MNLGCGEAVSNRCFISYRRQQLGDINLIVQAMRHRGITPWLDLSELANEPTENEIRLVIDSDDISSALLYLSHDVRGSEFMRNVELPALLARKRRDPKFSILPLLAPGVDYHEIAEIVGSEFGVNELVRWNLMRPCHGTSFLPTHVREVALKVLTASLRRNSAASRDSPSRLRLNSRHRPGFERSALLSLDWSDLFLDQVATETDWKNDLIPALEDVYNAVSQILPGSHLVADGLLGMPAALALGRAFASPRGIRLDWLQKRSDRNATIWSLASDEPLAFESSCEGRDISSQDLALVASITDSARGAFDRSSDKLPKMRAVLYVDLDPLSNQISSGQAAYLARKTVAALRTARSTYRTNGAVHVFIAGPVGFGVLLAQELNTFGKILTYEYCPTAKVPYVEAARLA